MWIVRQEEEARVTPSIQESREIGKTEAGQFQLLKKILTVFYQVKIIYMAKSTTGVDLESQYLNEVLSWQLKYNNAKYNTDLLSTDTELHH